MEDKKTPEQLFSEYFPEINIDNLNRHGEIEKEVCKYVPTYSRKQWEVLLSGELDDLFQDGIPHVSWNTDRSLICRTLQKNFKPLTSTNWDETWVHVEKTWYQLHPDIILSVKIETPHLIGSGGSIRYFLNLEKERPEIFTHTAVIFSMDDNGKVYISGQYTQTLENCEDWVTENINHYRNVVGFRIFGRDSRKNN